MTHCSNGVKIFCNTDVIFAFEVLISLWGNNNADPLCNLQFEYIGDFHLKRREVSFNVNGDEITCLDVILLWLLFQTSK